MEQGNPNQLEVTGNCQAGDDVANIHTNGTGCRIEKVFAIIGLEFQTINFVDTFAADGSAADMPVAPRHVLHVCYSS